MAAIRHIEDRPRVVFVTRQTPYKLLLARYATRGQAQFYLKTRNQDIKWYEQTQHKFEDAFGAVRAALPSDWRRVHITREELPQFLFAEDDIVTVVGQDGLIANVAKYLNGQLVLGVNPDPESFDGVLCRLNAPLFEKVIPWLDKRFGPGFKVQFRAMALAEREDGQKLLALNEIYIGHRSHQSARYTLTVGGRRERQSSSGVICSTGTGCTGWARSIAEQRGIKSRLPAPQDDQLVWFVREPFPSVSTGTKLNVGIVKSGGGLEIHSEMGDGGVIFADGIEQDFLEFTDGQAARIRIADRKLNLLVPEDSAPSQSKADQTLKEQR